MKKVTVIYTHDNNGSAESLGRQELAARRALDEVGIEHREAVVLRDVGLGIDDARPALVQLRELIESGKVAALAIYDLERLGRSCKVVVNLLNRVWECGGRVISAMGGELFKSSFAMLSLLAPVKTFRGIGRHRRRAGGGFALSAMFGYRTSVVPEPAQAEVVRLIFQRFAEGHSAASIASELNHNAISAPGTKSSLWRAQNVRRVIADPRYTGRDWARTTAATSEGNADVRPELQLVDEAVWREVQRRLNDRRRENGRGSGSDVL